MLADWKMRKGEGVSVTIMAANSMVFWDLV